MVVFPFSVAGVLAGVAMTAVSRRLCL